MTSAFYDCDPHAETYRHRTEAEAIIAFLEETQGLSDYADPEVRARFGAIMVMRFERGKIDPAFTAQQAHHITEVAVDNWSDEYGGLGNGTETAPAKDAIETARRRIQLVLRELFSELPVWHFEHVGTRSVLAHEVIEMVRNVHPELFDGEVADAEASALMETAR